MGFSESQFHVYDLRIVEVEEIEDVCTRKNGLTVVNAERRKGKFTEKHTKKNNELQKHLTDRGLSRLTRGHKKGLVDVQKNMSWRHIGMRDLRPAIETRRGSRQ